MALNGTVLGVTQARVFTPPLPQHVDPLTGEILPEYTHGPACVAFAETMLGMTLFPWQVWLLNHALELNDDGTYRFRTVVVMVARQNGKTMIEIVLALWHMYALKHREIIGTAQDLANAEKAWKEAVAMAQADEELADLIPDDGLYFGHPKQFWIQHETGESCEYRIAAATRRGGRGFSGDLILLDELREHQNWESWAAVTNTMNARPRAQAWAFSNAADLTGVVLNYLRAVAHRELGWPDGDEDVQSEFIGEVEALPDFEELEEFDFDTGFFEWSMPKGMVRNNPQGLAQANPSLNHTEVTVDCITLRALISQIRTTPAHVIEMEVCCRTITLADAGPFAEDSWSSTMCDDGVKPPEGAKKVVCVEVSERRVQTYIARAAYDNDEQAIVGISHDRAGTDWVVPLLIQMRDAGEIDGIVVRAVSGAPAMNLLEDMYEAELPVIEWKGDQVSAACGEAFDRLRDKRVKHLPHGPLDRAATTAVPLMQSTGGWVVDIKKSPYDTAPLNAFIGAVWGLDHLEEQESMYASEPVFVLRGRR